MSVYVDRLPKSCYECVCNDDGWKCGINREDISHNGRRKDCPLKVIVRLESDLISRQAAIDAVTKYFIDEYDKMPYEYDEEVKDNVFTDMKWVDISLEHNKEIRKVLKSLPPVEPKIYGNEHNCIMTIFGECSYSETGCGSCAVVEKVRDALAKAQMKTQNSNENSNEDAISRKVVEEMLMESWVDGFEYQGDLFGGLAKIPSVVPSVTPTERTGEWVSLFDGNEWFIHCSKCKTQHYEEDLLMGGSELPDYCPNCGAKMKGGTENDR